MKSIQIFCILEYILKEKSHQEVLLQQHYDDA